MPRTACIALFFVSCVTTITTAGSGFDAELNVYLRGEPEDAWVIIETDDDVIIREAYRPRVIIIRNLNPGKATITIGNKRGITFDIMLKANMRAIAMCEWVDGKFNIVDSPRWLPLDDSRFRVTSEMLNALPFERVALAPMSILPGVVGTDAPNIHGATQRTNRFLVDGVDATDPFDGTLELRLPFVALEQLALRYDTPGAEGSTVSLATTPMYSFDGNIGGMGSFFYETSDFPGKSEGLSFTRERAYGDAEALFGWGSTDGGTRLLGAVRYLGDDFREQPERFRPVETRLPAAFLRFEKRLGGALLLKADWYSSFTKKGSFFAPLTSEVEIRESDAELVTADERSDVQLFNTSLGYRDSQSAAEVSFSYYRGNLTREPSSGNRSAPTLFDDIADPAILEGGSILDESRDDLRERLSFGASYERELYLLGWHRLSAAASGRWSDMRIERAYNGGFSYGYSETLGRVFRRYSYDQNGGDSILDQRFVRRYRLALGDRWSLGRLSLDFGLTFDKTSGGNDVADIFDWSSLEPRVEAEFDLYGDGSLILRGDYHRSYFRLLGVHIPGNPYSRIVRFFDTASGSWDVSPLNRVEQIGYRADGVDAAIRRPYADIFSLGADIALGERSVLSGAWTWRRERDLIEDIETNLWPNYSIEESEDELGNDYDYFARNPGLDDTLQPKLFLTNPGELKREYYGVDLMFTFEPDSKTQLQAAYTWSRTSGNIDNTLDESTGGSRVYNDPNERINADGFLSSDNRHMLRLALVWRGPLGIDVGGLLHYDSGMPLNRLRLNPDDGRFEIRADPRGSVYRVDATTTIDLRLSRRVHFGERMTGTVILDLFNLTDDDAPRAYFVDDKTFGLPSARREPRRWRLGLQFRF